MIRNSVDVIFHNDEIPVKATGVSLAIVVQTAPGNYLACCC